MNPYRILHLLILSALLITGCGTELDNNGDGAGGDFGRELGETSTFTATIEGGATKTLLSGLPGGTRPVLWASDDSIRIDGLRYDVTDRSTDMLMATLSPAGAMAPKNGRYKAYYPTSIYNNGSPALPAIQKYRGTKTLSGTTYPVIADLPMYAESTTTRLDFKNLCAVLNFRLTGTDKVTSVVVESTKKALWGPFTVTDHAAVLPSSLNAVAANRKVTLDCGTGGVQLDVATPTDFFVAIPKGKYEKGDLKITIYSGTTELASLANLASELDTERSYIYESARNFTTVIAGGMVVQTTDPDLWIFNLYDYTLSHSEAKIWTGESVTVNAFSSSSPAPDYFYSLTTNPTLLSLSQTSGESTTLTAKTTPGETTLAVKASRLGIEKSDKTCKVTVQKLESMALSHEGTALNSGDVISLTFLGGSLPTKTTLTATVLYHDGTASGQRLESGWTWTSDNHEICTVDPATGVVTAVNPGEAKITCTIVKGAGAGRVELTKTCDVRFVAPFSFSISPESATLWTGESFTLQGSGDSDWYYFTVSDGSSLSLSLQGSQTRAVVTAGDVAEEATVTVRGTYVLNGIEYSYRKRASVTVRKLVSLDLDQTTLSLSRGGSATLTPSASYDEGTTSGLSLDLSGQTLLWGSSDPTVVTVSNGRVTAAGSGSATISCTLTKGNVTLTASCSVRVP